MESFIVTGTDFEETYHWHSGKPLSDDYDNTKDQSLSKLNFVSITLFQITEEGSI